MAKKSKYRAPNGEFYDQNDIDYLVNNGYSVQGALDALAQSDKYRKKVSTATVKPKPQVAQVTVKIKFSKYKAPNGNYYEQNDIDYLVLIF